MANTEPNSGIKYGWARGESGWGTDMNENLELIGRLIHHTALSLASAPPSAPGLGDVHLVADGATGTFSGRAGQVAAYNGSDWTFYNSKDNWVFVVDGKFYRSSNGSWYLLKLDNDNFGEIDGSKIQEGSIEKSSLSQEIQEKINEPAITLGAGLQKDAQGRIRVNDSYIINLVGGGGGGPIVQDESWFSYDHADGSYDVDNVRVTSVHEGMRRCLVADDGTINYFLDPYDSSKKENGSAADLTGADGQVMVYIPKFYAMKLYEGTKEIFYMSAEPKFGLVLHPAFIANDGTTELDYILIGAYPATVYSASNSAVIDGLNLDNNTSRVSLSNDKLCSLPGNYLMVGLQRSEYRTLAANRGAGWSQWSYYAWQAVLFLFYTEYGELNSQDALGDGNVWREYYNSSSNQGDSPHVINGVSNSLGNQSGAVEDTNKNDSSDWTSTPFISYRGIENLWGNGWQWIDGCFLSSHAFYVTGDQTKFADSTTSHIKLGANLPSTSGSTILSFQNLASPLMLVGTVGGDTDTYVGDNYWVGSSTRVGRVGGGADLARLAGGSALLLNAAASDRGRNRGARAMFKPNN